MLVQLSKRLLAVGASVMFIASLAWGQASQPAAPSQTQTPAQPQWKDRAEYDLVQEIGKTQDPNKRLELLNQWKQKYPDTAFKGQRQQLYIQTYQQLNKAPEMVTVAKEMVADDPKNVLGLYFLMTLTIGNGQPDMLDSGEKAANQALSNLDAIFASDRKPAGVKDEDWAKEKPKMEALAHKTLGWVALQRKDNEKAEQEFTKVLQLTPTDGQVSYWLGTAIIAQRKPEKQAAAIYQFARAASYDGEGAMAPAARADVKKYVDKIYATYHGDNSGEDELLTLAKSNPMPPPDWKLKSVVDKQREEIEAANKLATENPQLARWLAMRNELVGANSDAFFNEMKGKALPELKGKLVSQTPERNPKEIVIGITGTTPEVTIKLDAALGGKMEPGSDLTVKDAVAESFTKEPFNLTVSAEKGNIVGWKGGPAAAPAKRPVKKAGARKK